MARKRREHKIINGIEHTWCSWHKKFEPVSEFGIRTAAWDGLNPMCRAGAGERDKAHRVKPVVKV